MCDRKFQVSYLVKYISGKEEHQLVDVAGTKEITEVRTTTEEHGHEKITGCREVVEEREKRNPHMAREICIAEIIRISETARQFRATTRTHYYTDLLLIIDHATVFAPTIRPSNVD